MSKKIRPWHSPKTIPPKTGQLGHDASHPAFSFEHVRNGYDVRDCTQEEKAQLALTLTILSKSTWAEIKNQGRHKGGFEKLPQLSHKLPPKFREMTPIAFRFAGMKPMIGVRVDQIFYIIWLDSKMELYRH